MKTQIEENILQIFLTLTQRSNVDQIIIQFASNSLVELVQKNQDDMIRIFISIAEQHLNQNIFLLSVHELINLSSFFYLLREEQRDNMLLKLFSMLETTKFDTHRDLLCKYICSLAKQNSISLTSHIIPYVWEIFSNNNSSLYQSAFEILTIIFEKNSEAFDSQFNDLQLLFRNGLQLNDKVLVACIEAMGSFFTNSKNSKKIGELVPLMIECLIEKLQENSKNTYSIMNTLNKVSKVKPKKLNKSFELLFSVILSINKKQVDFLDLEQLALDILVNIVEKSPQLLNNNNTYNFRLWELIFNHMMQIDKYIVGEEWSQEVEYFSDDFHLNKVKFGMELINRILKSVKDGNLLRIFLDYIREFFTKSDWRYIFVAEMAASIGIKYIDEEEQLEQILISALPFLKDEKAILRYGVFQLINLSSEREYLPVTLQIQLKKILLSYLDDPAPQVVLRVAVAIEKFWEQDLEKGRNKRIEVQQLNISLFEKLFKLIKNSDYDIIKQNCIDTVSSFALLKIQQFNSYLSELLPFLFTLLSTRKENHHQNLIGSTIQCLFFVSQSVEKQIFLPYLEELVSIMISTQNSIVAIEDERIFFCIRGWYRIFYYFCEELVDFLPQIVPGLFRLLEDIFKNDIIYEDNNKSIFDMLQAFIFKFGKDAFVYTGRILEMMEILTQFNKTGSMKKNKLKLIDHLIQHSKVTRETLNIIARQFLQNLAQSYQMEDREGLEQNIIFLTRSLNKIGNFLAQQEISMLTDIIKSIFLYSKKEQTTSEQIKNNLIENYIKREMEIEIEDEDEKENSNNQRKKQEPCYFLDLLNADEIQNLIRALFFTHKEEILSFAEELYSSVLDEILQKTSSLNQQKYGLFTINAMIEFLGYEFYKDKLDYFRNKLLSFSLSDIYEIRLLEIKGIGIFALQTPPEIFSPMLDEFTQHLQVAFNLPRNKSRRKYFHFKYSIITSIGQIIKHHSVYQQEILSFWISNLPIYEMKTEDLLFLAKLCIKRFDILTEKMVIHLIKAFRYELETQESNVNELIEAYQKLQEHPYVISQLDTIFLDSEESF